MTVETSIPIYADRHMGPQAFGQIAQAVQASGTVDYIQGIPPKEARAIARRAR